MFPIPKHLTEILKPVGNHNNQFEVTGEIICDCGFQSFALKIVGNSSEYDKHKEIWLKEIKGQYYLIVKAKCNNCQKEHLIFDDGFHGWNGFVCSMNAKDLPRPEAEVWKCNKCDATNHSLTVNIQSRGQEDFIENVGHDFDHGDWIEAFGWITIKIVCNSCKETNIEWISHETE